MAFGMGPVVRLVNRVRDADGKQVPWEGMAGGEALWVVDTLDVPLGVARILIHQSMYKVDPANGSPSYRLGCVKLGAPEEPLTVDEVTRIELFDRELMSEDEQKKMVTKRIHNPINPAMSRGARILRPTDEGAMPGEFGGRVQE